MNTLMHICCAPCANRPIDALHQEGIAVTGFWFNPNIHPYTEYQARKRTLEDYSREIGMKLIIGGSYDLRTFICSVAGNIDGRCAYCYRMPGQLRLALPQGAQLAGDAGGDEQPLPVLPQQGLQALHEFRELPVDHGAGVHQEGAAGCLLLQIFLPPALDVRQVLPQQFCVLPGQQPVLRLHPALAQQGGHLLLADPQSLGGLPDGHHFSVHFSSSLSFFSGLSQWMGLVWLSGAARLSGRRSVCFHSVIGRDTDFFRGGKNFFSPPVYRRQDLQRHPGRGTSVIPLTGTAKGERHTRSLCDALLFL